MKPLVSIVTPSFNQANFLEKTINSVLDQNYEKIEFVIMDGCSTDDSVKIIQEYSQNLTYWESSPDEGPADACNKGFQHTSGNILGYLNSDDLLLPNAVAEVVSVFSENNEADIVFGNAYMMDQIGCVYKKIYTPPFFNPYLYALGGFGIAQQATFWRRDIYESVGGFNEKNKTSWDAEFWIDAALKGANFKHIDQFIAAFRYYPESISGSGRLKEEYLKDRERLFVKVFGRSSNIFDKLIFRNLSRLISKFIPPWKLFPTLGISGDEVISKL